MTATRQNTLQAVGFTCIRGGRTLFAGLSFSVQPSKALIIKGANGSGKTSLLRVLAGLLPTEEGTVQWRGEAGKPSKILNDEIHYLGHSDALKPYLTVQENLKIWGGLYGGEIKLDSAAKKTGVFPLLEIPVKFLSEGQKKRVNLARFLTTPKSIWLMDEPAAGLDQEGRTLLAGLIRDQLGANGIVIASTHQELGIKGAKTLTLGIKKGVGE